MRVIIVGNGIAGVMCSKFLRDRDFQADIDIFSEEKHHYYPKPNLIELLAGHLTEDKIFAFKEDWYTEKKIQIHLASPVMEIIPEEKKIKLQGGQEELYDILVLANGARPSIPPIKGADKKRVFTLRTLDDCLEIMASLKHHSEVTVLGGGLLGLEIARAMNTRGGKVQVFEFFPRLLPRQLDDQGAALLKRQIENMGISIYLDMACEEILGPNEVAGLRFKDGQTFSTEMVVVAAGVLPNVGLAEKAGLETKRGILVDHKLRTSDPNIFAIGDNVEFEGKAWGIIPAAFEQSKAAAGIISGEDVRYKGTIPSNSLKVAGLDVFSVGTVSPEDEALEIRKLDEASSLYRKIVIHNGRLIGAIAMGTKKGVPELTRLINNKTDVSQWKERLLEDDLSFTLQ